MTASATSASTDNIIALADASADASDKETVAERLVRLAQEAELFHDENGETFISAVVMGRRETWPLRSRGSREFLALAYHSATGKVPSGQPLQDALNVLHGKALYAGPEKPTHVRVAHLDDVTYFDLADEERNVIEIRPGAWTYVTDPPVRFRRPKAMQAVPKPEPGGTLDELRPFVNIPKDSSWRLVLAWLVALFSRGPFAWLALQGRQGSAKTSTSRTLRQVIDPNKAPVRAPPRSVRDLVIGASNSIVVVLDNLSFLTEELSDALCRLSTGGGLSTRELFTDLDEVIVDVQRAGIINAIADVAARGDLLDRCVLIELPPIPSGSRKTEAQLTAEFAVASPRIVGAILDTVAAVMAELPNVKLEDPPRMADYAMIGVATERALGWPPGTFLADYAEAIDAATDVALDAAIIAPFIRKLADEGQFEGTAVELLGRLNDMYDGRWPAPSPWSLPARTRARPKGWPAAPRVLSTQLRRLEPSLLAVGVIVTFSKTQGSGSRKIITIGKADSQSPPSAGSVPAVPPAPVPFSLALISQAASAASPGPAAAGTAIPSHVAAPACVPTVSPFSAPGTHAIEDGAGPEDGDGE